MRQTTAKIGMVATVMALTALSEALLSKAMAQTSRVITNIIPNAANVHCVEERGALGLRSTENATKNDLCFVIRKRVPTGTTACWSARMVERAG
ncbi:MAG: hypothetical protein FJY97_15900 [candidate division Zixibacteria bacterium]|nr:hypothetical protein [candidate division Zixibacteria bacterium]